MTVASPVSSRSMTNIWDEVLARIETKINRHSFYTWFKPTSFVADQGGTILVRVPNGLFRDWLTKHYSTVLNEALTELNVRPPSCRSSRRARKSPRSRPSAAAHPGSPVVDEAVADDESLLPEPITAQSGLNPRYTFDTFIVGSSNQFAHAASRAVAEAPSRSYNPLFIYGGVGLGKTHLMHAVGRYVLEHNAGVHADLHLVRTLHERDDQRRALRPDPRVPRTLSLGRRSARRRHSVPRRQGRHAERVFPHVQRAVRRAEADRASAATARRTRFPSSKNACDRDSSGGSSPTSRRRISRPRSRF